MDIGAGFIADPLIAPSGKVYSAGALQVLLEAIFSKNVDNRTHKCKDHEREGGQHDEKRQKESGKA